jgi:hypothetical protein
VKFALRITRTEILAARKRYVADASEMARENKAFAAGDRIAAGDLIPNNLVPIID